MQLSKRQVDRLLAIIETAQQILNDANNAEPVVARTGNKGPSTRRRGAELLAFKKMIKGERKKGASISELATKHGVTPSYLYQLR